ncbi:MAG: class I SAM-dependent rRNA methyltransferase [Nitrospiraceae bacterium]
MQDFRATGAVQISDQAARRLKDGHGWVYASDVLAQTGAAKAGDVVAVVTAAGAKIGHGFLSPQSTIRVRLITRGGSAISATVLEAALRAAVDRRRHMSLQTNAYRVIHGEADDLPGLIVDRYDDTLVMQTVTVGMEQRRQWLGEKLVSTTGACRVYLRNDTPARATEGLSLAKGFLIGEGATTIDIHEGAARFVVDIEQGQKTGWFCDQRDNRQAVAARAQGKDVLDAFCHTGAFGIHAALGGARSVAGWDSSRAAIEQARAHALVNQVGARCDFRAADAVDALKKLGRSRKRFDLVILDPPAQAKRRAARESALDGAIHLNALGLALVRTGGLLVTCSCSHHITEQDLVVVVERAARTVRRKVQIVERRGAAQDHPTLDSIPETRYLSCVLATIS